MATRETSESEAQNSAMNTSFQPFSPTDTTPSISSNALYTETLQGCGTDPILPNTLRMADGEASAPSSAINLTEDGGVTKQILQEGSGDVPEEGDQIEGAWFDRTRGALRPDLRRGGFLRSARASCALCICTPAG